MPDTRLSLVKAPAPQEHTGRVTLLERKTALDTLAGAGVSLPTAVAAATSVPADLIGCPELGRIAPGAAGDLVWLGPGLQARATWIGGRQAFGAGLPR